VRGCGEDNGGEGGRRRMFSRKAYIKAGLMYTYLPTQSHTCHEALLVGEVTGREYEVRGSTVL